MELSKRLQAVTNLVGSQQIVADIGTDHGYIPIYLIESGICSKVIAMDINEGPYLRAKQHIAAHQLDKLIDTRLSDGMQGLEIGEATTIILAGMGGGLVIKILEQDRRLWNHIQEVILQPQSEIAKVRTYLYQNQWEIVAEDMVREDGKFYPIMKVRQTEQKMTVYTEAELQYGRLLMQAQHPILAEFLAYDIEIKEKVLQTLVDKTAEHIVERIKTLKDELEVAYEVQRNITDSKRGLSSKSCI